MKVNASNIRNWAIDSGYHQNRWDLVVAIRNAEREKDPTFSIARIQTLTDDEIAPYIARYIIEETEF